MVKQRFVSAALLGAVLLTGCSTKMMTTVDVHSATDASMSASVIFSAEAAQAIEEDLGLEKDIQELIAKKTGQEVRTDSDDSERVYSSDLPYAKLTNASLLLGVSSAGLEPVGEEAATLNVGLVTPTDLIAAIEAGNADEVDREALTETIMKTTTISVKVKFPGDITEVTGPGTVSKDGNEATFTVPLDEFVPGTMSVSGSVVKPLFSTPILVGAGGALVLAIVSIFIMRRRR